MEIGDLIAQWDMNPLKKQGIIKPITEEEVSKDLEDACNNEDVKKYADSLNRMKEDGINFEYFINTKTRAVFSFPKDIKCSGAGYRLLYFRENDIGTSSSHFIPQGETK